MSCATTLGNSVFIHNSDLSGDVTVTVYRSVDGVMNQETIKIPGCDLIRFIANYVRKEKVSKLEQMNTDEILNI